MEDGCHNIYGVYGGAQGGHLPNSQMFPQNSPSIYTPTPQFSSPHYQNYQNHQNYQNPVIYSAAFFPSSAFQQISFSSGWIGTLTETGVSITPYFPMDQNSMLFYGPQCTNRPQLMTRNSLDNPYKNFKKQVVDLRPRRKISKKSKEDCVTGQWTKEEDRKLTELYKDFREDWAGISVSMQGRDGKQCRERYVNYLRPGIKKGPWSEDEERIFVEAQKKTPNCWVEIAKLLPGRTENQLKNRWNSTKRRAIGRKNKTKRKKNVKPKPTVLRDYIHGTGNYSSSASNTTNPATPTTVVSSNTPPKSYTYDSPSLDVPLLSDDEVDSIIQTLYSDVTIETITTFGDQSSIQDLQPQSHDTNMISPLGFYYVDPESENGSSSSLFSTEDTFNIYQNNDIQVSPNNYMVETPTFSNSFDDHDLYGYEYMNMDYGYNAQGGGFVGQ